VSNLQYILKKITKKWPEAVTEPFTNHPVANLFRNDFKTEIQEIVKSYNPALEIKASAGAGNWANVPWLSILDPKITQTTQAGIYPVYLFRADGTGFYLSLGFGTTDLKKNHGKSGAKDKSKDLKALLRKAISDLNSWNSKIDLRSTTSLGQSYEWASAGAKFYDSKEIPNDQKFQEDLLEMLAIYSQVENNFLKDKSDMDKLDSSNNNFLSTSLPKPFILLAGISGTGKTRFVREQAARFPEEKNYCLVSVRPDWHEPSDLLGYISRMSKTPEYICTDTLRFIASAWKHLIEAVTADAKGILDWRGKSLNEIAPFWLCLDEMNLAPVEQYFADYLSVLETREWLSAEQLESYNQDNATEHEYIYTCDPLLKSDVITTLPDESQIKMATTLGLDLDSPNDQKLWDYFCQSGIAIPFNLIVAGTVNMDETTHSFSRKVIDRALSFDFGEFFPNDFDAFFEPKTQPLTLSYPVWSDGRDLNALQTSFDTDGQQSVAFLKAINTILDGTPFQLAYRALNELLINVTAAQPTDKTMLLAVWDDFIMTKLLPRIEGDADKLSVQSQQADDFTNETVLDNLLRVLEEQLSAIWEGETRPDLYREYLIEQEDSKTILIECRSKTKLQWMKKRLDSATFTSFWP